MKSPIQYYTLFLAAFLTIAIFMGSSRESSSDAPAQPEGSIPQIIKAVDLNQPFEFAGESLPMDDFDTRERLDLELMKNTYWHSNTILFLKKANKYFPTIERILKEHGIPEDFKYVAVAESSLQNAVSPAGARGFWQLMAPTAREYGLEISNDVDERYHLEKSTVAACKLIKSYYKRFNNWTLTAAAYNIGVNKLDRLLEEQHASSFFDLNLNQETNRYIFRLVAIKAILSDPNDFGFYLDEADMYQPLPAYRTVEVSTDVENWGAFAAEQGTSYRMLKVYNPWLIDSDLKNSRGKTYEIRIPK
jgi:hypothetical protein